MTETSSITAVARTLADRRRSLRSVAVGNAVEWFDWTLYTTFSAYLALNLFESTDPTSALLATFAVFAAGFIARPLGGLLFGWLGDRRGRKITLVITILLLAATNAAIALTPTFEMIGIWASVLLLLWRLLQGLAYGGETGVAYTYAAELAPPERRAFWSSSVFIGVLIGVMGATALAALLTLLLSTEAMEAWGWRVGFAVGGVLGLYALILRRRAGESAVFVSERSSQPQEKRRLTKREVGRFAVRIVLIAAFAQVGFYIWVALPPTLAIATRGMDPQGAYIASLLAQLLAVAWLPVCGLMADRFGRKRMLAIYATGVILVAFPISMILGPEPWTLFVSQLLGLIVWCLICGMFPALLAEQVPTAARARGVGLVSSLTAAVFGGTAPYLNTWLGSIGLGWVFNVYIMGLGALALIAAFIIRETAGVPLEDIGAGQDDALSRESTNVRVADAHR